MNQSEATTPAANQVPLVAPTLEDAESYAANLSPSLEAFFVRINNASPEHDFLKCRMLNTPSAGRDVFAEDDE